MSRSRTRRWRSRLRAIDVLRESWLEATRRPGRAFISGLGVALGTAGIVATITLVATVRYQVSDEFDALRATQVEVRSGLNDGESQDSVDFPPPDAVVDRVRTLSGVEGVAVIRESREDVKTALNRIVDPTAPTHRLKVYGLNHAGLTALDTELTGPGWVRWHDETGQRVVVLSAATAAAIGAGDIGVGDNLYVGDLLFTVVGILEGSPRLPALMSGVVIPIRTVDLYESDPGRDRLIAVTSPGAAGLVAAALPTAISPTAPQSWTAYAAEDDLRLRRGVDDQIQSLALGLGLVVLILGIVTIGNAILSSVMQRIHEIGLRRALGARPRHIAAHVLADAAFTGLIGGGVGAIGGLVATLGVTALRGWIPVVDPKTPVLAMIGGLVSGALAGLYPARVGSRLSPTEALRRE